MKHFAGQLTAAAAVWLAAPATAYANGSATVPEADTLALISLAMAGVLIGRRLSMGKRKD